MPPFRPILDRVSGAARAHGLLVGGQSLFAFGPEAPGGSQEGSMNEKTLKGLEEFAKRKGFLLTILEEGEGIANFEGGKYVLEATEDGDAESASFKTETALRRFLEGFPDHPVTPTA